MKKTFLSFIFTFCVLGACASAQANLFGSLSSWFGQKAYSVGETGCFLNGYVDRNIVVQSKKKELSPVHPWRQLYIYKTYATSLKNHRFYRNAPILNKNYHQEQQRDRVITDAERLINESENN